MKIEQKTEFYELGDKGHHYLDIKNLKIDNDDAIKKLSEMSSDHFFILNQYIRRAINLEIKEFPRKPIVIESVALSHKFTKR